MFLTSVSVNHPCIACLCAEVLNSRCLFIDGSINIYTYTHAILSHCKKYRAGGLNKRHLFHSNWEVDIWYQCVCTAQVWWEWLLSLRQCFILVSSCGEWGKLIHSFKDHSPVLKAPPVWCHLNLPPSWTLISQDHHTGGWWSGISIQIGWRYNSQLQSQESNGQ